MGLNQPDDKISWRLVEKTIQEVIQDQENKLFAAGKRFVPHLTKEDLLQPNDFEELETNPYFRYEEGVLCGLLTIQMAMQALRQERLHRKSAEYSVSPSSSSDA
ncbi:hypothetical protein [Estrella lausannensis]|uniref:Uncharacterized protein n=1 Tax=Estrella lausannensis TaxID=483423 RepID=A0A0H5E7N4_9BACT|nr:hypothetical protein [Estrella lausannensis]CRX39340.1 Conserved hypothetical protein [Estrella lausannensis]